MEYVKIKDNIVVELISTSKKPNGAWREVKLNGGLHIGDDIRMFDKDWNLRPTKELVDEGFIELAIASDEDFFPKGTVLQKVENDEIVPKTDYDFAKEGVITLGDMQYLDDDKKTVETADSIEHLLELNKISKKDARLLKEKEVRAYRNGLLEDLDVVVMNPLRWKSLSETEQVNIATYRQSLLDITDQDEFPWNIQWPHKPSTLY